ncbi:MAG: leucine-rich repeat protein [Candidatus Saccharibacteria bacterium]
MKLIPSILAGFFIAFSSLTFGQSININTAKTVAQNHLLSVSKNQLKTARLNQQKPKFVSYSVTSESRDTLYYVLNDTINHSFVIVSGDRRSTPIIGYSLEGNIDVNNQPPAFMAWIESRKKEIEYIKQNDLQADSKISEQWDQLSTANANISAAGESVEPLVKTKWDQGCYYNSLCPFDMYISFYCGHLPTGCTATAMAQIMKYWNYPTKGTGSHSYLSAGNGILSADFGSTTYQWSQMPNELTSENDAVATLMYHCGVATEMRYDPSGSGAYDPKDELIKYFNYSPLAEYVDKRSFLPGDWTNLLKSELNDGRPIWYMGRKSPCDAGHAFVCDGYQDSNYFHFNWGWGGAYDGYFYLESLNPGVHQFTLLQAAIIKIFPKDLPEGYKGMILSTKTVGMGPKGGSARVDISSSEEWTASSDQTWLAFTPASGTIGSHAITFTIAANPTADIRQANVTISSSGLPSQTIIVTQYGKVEVTAGNLKSNLGSQLSSITSVVLKGTIDARDFRTMRDEMPALTEIDLSGVTIASYTGKEGTIGDEIYDYPAHTIPNFAFLYPESSRSKSRLESIVLPSTITAINDYAFEGCQNLKIEDIPSSVASIGDGAFLECSFPKSIVIPSSVTFIGNAAFKSFNGVISVDANNPNYSSLDGVLFNKTQTRLIQCPVSKTGDYTIPSSVTTIGNLAFYGCNNLTSISIPSSVSTIEGYAFNYCTGLTAVTIPSSVTSIGQRVFGGFKGSITVDADNSKYSALEGVLFNKDQTELIECPVSKAGTYTIPSTVTTVKLEAFHSCVDISSMIIPASVKNIGSFAFNCAGLSSVYAHSVPPVNLDASPSTFAEVSNNQCILYIPYGTKSLYAAANQWNGFRTMIEMPGFFVSDKSVDLTMNGDTVWVNIASNTDWTVSSNQAWLSVNVHSGTAGCHEITLTAPANTTMSPRKAILTVSATGYESRTIEVTQYGSVEVTAGSLKTILGGRSTSIKSLVLIGTIDARDFKTMRDNMPGLTEIDLSGATIAEYTGTEGTYGNYNITYPSNMIPYQAFYNVSISLGKSTLKSIILPHSATGIGSFAFGRNTGLKTITIPSSITTIENQAFLHFKGNFVVEQGNMYYSSHDSILFNKDQTTLIQCSTSKTGAYTVPSSVTFIDDNAFGGCSGLTRIVLPSSVTKLGEGVFSYCSGLTSINIPSSVTTLPQNSFIYCHKLTALAIPSSVVSINHYAFAGCDGLNSIYASAMTPVNLSHSSYVFSSINKTFCTLYVPTGTKSLYAAAYQWKDFTNIVEINPPVAHAGNDQQADENTLVTLDGSASTDPENDVLTYFWTAPEGIVLSSITDAKPSFKTPEVAKDSKLTFSLTVNDGKMCSTASKVYVTVKQVNKAPVANAGIDKEVTEENFFQLDGFQSSDFDNDALTYTWIAPAGITLNSTTEVTPSFITPHVDTPTTFTFSLIVNDGHVDSPADQVAITVTPNKAPLANAGTDQQVNENDRFTLDASASSDPDNDVLTYLWTAPTGITLSSSTSAKPQFITPEVTTDTNYTFRLEVFDGKMHSTADQVVITVKNVDKAPYVKSPVNYISVDRTSADKTIELQSIFADDDLNDVLSYCVTSNSDDQVVTTKVSGGYLTLCFSSQYAGQSEVVITASSNGKQVSSKFNVEVKTPAGINSYETDQPFSVYPNPTNGKVKVIVEQNTQIGNELIVKDIHGRSVLKQKIHEKEQWIDLSGNIPGIYLFKTSSDNTRVQKVVLK